MRYLLSLLALTGVVPAAEKPTPVGEGSNKVAAIQASLYAGKASIRQAVGYELDEGIVVVELKLIPAAGQKIAINRDDFLLRSDRDGQRATPYAPTQIADGAVLVVKTVGGGGSVGSESRGPVWGGLGGGMPRRMPGNGSGIGNSAGTTEAQAEMKDIPEGKDKQDPLLTALEKKILPEKEIAEPATGQLYFLMEGKQKTKDIELLYKTSAGRVSVRFK